MKLDNFLAIMLVTILGIVTPAYSGSTAMQANIANKAIQQAKVAQNKAALIGGEWRDTEKLIQASQDAVQKGDFTLAISLATQAQQQGILGYKQAVQQKNLKFPVYLQ